VGAGVPGGADLYVIGVNDSYVYDPTHTTFEDIDVESIVFPPTEILGFTLNGTTLDAPNTQIGAATVGETLHGIVILFAWDDEVETALVAYLNQTTNSTLPQSIVTGQFELRWNDQGICRL
jgi:hypothetical protein